MKKLIILSLVLSMPVVAEDARYCYAKEDVPRTSTGTIKRSQTAVKSFKKEHPCPVTPCLGWEVDHVIPLVSGGCDTIENMQWLPVQIKTCAGLYCKDRWEQKVYGKP
jgi:hypothetical protein